MGTAEKTIDDLPEELVEIFGQDAVTILLESGADENNLQQFATFLDWITVLMIMGTKHALPSLSDREVIELLEIIGRRISVPGFKHRWDWARRWIDRMGVKIVISKIKYEFDRTLHGDKA